MNGSRFSMLAKVEAHNEALSWLDGPAENLRALRDRANCRPVVGKRDLGPRNCDRDPCLLDGARPYR
mgnify:CR=1 FL=1